MNGAYLVTAVVVAAGFCLACLVTVVAAARQDRHHDGLGTSDAAEVEIAEGDSDGADRSNASQYAQACLGDEPDFAGLCEYSQPIYQEQDIRR